MVGKKNRREERKHPNIMDQKTLNLIEYPKILEKLSGYAAFSTSAELALALQPSTELEEVRNRLNFTREARLLLSMNPDIRVGGVHDVRPSVDRAALQYTLAVEEIMDIKDTLVAARKLQRPFFSKRNNLTDEPIIVNKDDLREDSPELLFPHLVEIAKHLTPPKGIVDRITQTIGDDKQVLDNASKKLAVLRSEIKIAHNRLMTKLQAMISDANITPMLQEAIITQRGGRYVIPLQAGFKGKVPAIIHDQSGSGQTIFIEPLAVVELNNTWQQLKLDERDEVRRILAELSAEIGEVRGPIRRIVESVAEIDFALMCAKYAEDLRASEPEALAFAPARDLSHPGSHLHFIKARHPLLPKNQVVPVDITLEPPIYAMVITGPNTGGKTVTLKTTGLLIVMAQSGLHIPVQSGSKFTVFEDIYADIGDEQSIEQSLSTFSGHIKNMVHILDEAHSQTLVLLDELGSGTDPLEGAALAHAILIHLTNRKIPCLVATHYPELKNFAYNTPGVINAAMSFDLETLSPTYHLLIGLPGRSNALLIAERVGLSKRIIELARETLNPHDRHADALLEDIQFQKEQMREARESAQQDEAKAEKLRLELQQRLDKIENERVAVLEQARLEGQEQVKKLQKEIRALKQRMKRAVRYAEKASQAALVADPEQKRAAREALRQEKLAEKVEQKAELLEESLEDSVERKAETLTPTGEQTPRVLQAGDAVFIRSFQKEGTLVSLEGDTAEVQLGPMRMKTNLNDLERTRKKPDAPVSAAVRMALAQQQPAPTMRLSTFTASPGMELDLRGQRVEDALDKLQPYLEQAYLAQLPFSRIIHGKGSGVLRDVVRDVLNRSTYVASWEEAQENEGGSGVTVVRIKK